MSVVFVWLIWPHNYKMEKLTVSMILKNKDAIKEADVAKGVMMLWSKGHKYWKRWKKVVSVAEWEIAGRWLY